MQASSSGDSSCGNRKAVDRNSCPESPLTGKNFADGLRAGSFYPGTRAAAPRSCQECAFVLPDIGIRLPVPQRRISPAVLAQGRTLKWLQAVSVSRRMRSDDSQPYASDGAVPATKFPPAYVHHSRNLGLGGSVKYLSFLSSQAF